MKLYERTKIICQTIWFRNLNRKGGNAFWLYVAWVFLGGSENMFDIFDSLGNSGHSFGPFCNIKYAMRSHEVDVWSEAQWNSLCGTRHYINLSTLNEAFHWRMYYNRAIAGWEYVFILKIVPLLEYASISIQFIFIDCLTTLHIIHYNRM